MTLFYQYIIACAVIGFVWAEILTQPGEVFAWVFKLIDRLPLWLAKPLGGCAKCVTGQIAFWWYLFAFRYSFNSLPQPDQIFCHVYFVSLSILITWVLQKIAEKL